MQEAISLSPAEALLLLKPNRTSGLRTVRVTLLSLLVKGILRIEEQDKAGLFRNRKIPHLRVVAPAAPSPPHVAALIEVVQAAQADGGAIRDVVKRATKAFGAGCALYNTRFIGPALIEKGLLEERRIVFLRSYHATPAGEAERSRIEDDIDRARQLPKLLTTDPAEAAALALALGGTLLLVDDLSKHYRQLGEAMRAGCGDSGSDAGGDGGSFDTGGFSGGFDLASFDLGSLDAGAFDALDSSIASFDSGFSDAGGDGGGGDSSSN